VLGFNALTQELITELDKKNILLIEDVCESHGTTHVGVKAGTFGWASNFSFYYAHHMTTIEGGMISTNDFRLYEMLRIMRSHGMVREASSDTTKRNYERDYPDLNPDFIFAYPSHNMRPTEINAILGLSQIKRLESQIIARRSNFERFLESIDDKFFRTNFEVDGNSNYAFTLILNEPDFELRTKVENSLSKRGIEFRRGLAGGGNQLRQPYLRKRFAEIDPKSLPNTDFVHHFGWYIGNYPGINAQIFKELEALTL
jgi:CDP-6-deoxy-D-xylo-4-hexulose-3-dehydrase